MTVALCNGKGGSGKTTVTILLASALSEAGHDVAVLDTDPQRTATKWIAETGDLMLAQNGKSYKRAVHRHATAARVETGNSRYQPRRRRHRRILPFSGGFPPMTKRSAAVGHW
jgi:cellulose biosynthesis protein BcsQ